MKLISYFFSAIAIFTLVVWALVLDDFSFCPTISNVATDNVYPFNDHGRIVYITYRQKLAECVLLPAGIAINLMGIFFKELSQWWESLK